MGIANDERLPILQATVQPLPTIGEGCISRFDPDTLNDQQGADFSAAAQLYQQWLAEHNPEQSAELI